jgi:hypothetical protein
MGRAKTICQDKVRNIQKDKREVKVHNDQNHAHQEVQNPWGFVTIFSKR